MYILEKYEINKYLEKFHNSVNDLNLALDSVSLEKKLKELNELRRNAIQKYSESIINHFKRNKEIKNSRFLSVVFLF